MMALCYVRRVRCVFCSSVKSWVAPGSTASRRCFRSLKRELGIDLTIASAEGATGGFGIGKGHAVYLHKLGVDVITAGDFAYFKRDAVSYFGQARFLLRPANYPYGNPGRGWLVARPRSEQSRPGSPARHAEPKRVAAAAPSATAATTEAAAQAVAGAADAGAAGSPAEPDRQDLPIAHPRRQRGTRPRLPQAERRNPSPAGAAGGTRAGGAEHIPNGGRRGRGSSGGRRRPARGTAPRIGYDTPAPAASRSAPGRRQARRPRRPPSRPLPLRLPAQRAVRPRPESAIISLLGQAGFSRVHLRSPFEMAERPDRAGQAADADRAGRLSRYHHVRKGGHEPVSSTAR